MRALALFLALAGLLQPLAAHAQATKFRVGICARTVSTAVGAPFAVAMKMGWFKQEGLEVEVVPLPGSIDFLLKWGVLKQRVETGDLITNDLIEVINRLDTAKIATEARAYTYSR
jgi:hypothetical protein